MKDKYAIWILDRIADSTGKCAERTEEIVSAFPELKRVRGHYICPQWGEREHWWCVAPDGEIVDPTAFQFPSKGILGEYREHIEGSPEPTGKCHNCGGYCFNGDWFCSEKCERETMVAMGFTHKTSDGAWAQ